MRKWWENLRNTYTKNTEIPKSGDAPRKLTARTRYLIEKLSFLSGHIKSNCQKKHQSKWIYIYLFTCSWCNHKFEKKVPALYFYEKNNISNSPIVGVCYKFATFFYFLKHLVSWKKVLENHIYSVWVFIHFVYFPFTVGAAVAILCS